MTNLKKIHILILKYGPTLDMANILILIHDPTLDVDNVLILIYLRAQPLIVALWSLTALKCGPKEKFRLF